MDPAQFQSLIDTINGAGQLVGGFVLALIFATTWKG